MKMSLDINTMGAELQKVNVRRLLRSRRYFVILCAVIVITLLMILFAVIPLITQSVSNVVMMQQERQESAKLEQKVRTLNQLDSLRDSAQNAKVELALPSEKPLLQLLAGVNAAAAETQVQVTNIETSPGKLATQSAQKTAASAAAADQQIYGVDTLAVKIQLAGSLEVINSFIRRIEQTSPMMSISQMQLSEVQTGTDKAKTVPSAKQFTASLTLTTYYFTRSIQVAVDEPLPETSSKDKDFLAKLETYLFPDVQKYQSIQGGGIEDLFGLEKSLTPAVITPAKITPPVIPLPLAAP